MNRISDAEVGEATSQFDRDGYVVLEGFFSHARVDRARAAVRAALRERPNEVVVDCLQTGRRSLWSQATGRSTQGFKFNDLYLLCEEVRQLALDPALSVALEDLLGEPPVLCNSLNLEKGTSQPKHIDSLYMTPRTPHRLIASWIALEDAHPDAGPLVYYPGSHRIPLYVFNDGTHHASREEIVDWFDYIDVQLRLRGLREKAFLARKGDVFVWHADLVHGGSPVRDPRRTRASQVNHYFGKSDCLGRGLEVVPLNRGNWLPRLRQPVRAEPDSFGPECPFPEETYLERHPDVRLAVDCGECPSGMHHYRNHGFREGRGV